MELPCIEQIGTKRPLRLWLDRYARRVEVELAIDVAGYDDSRVAVE